MKQLLKFMMAAVVALVLAALPARADINFTVIGAENLYQGTNIGSGLAPTDSIVLLVADTSDTGNFGPLYAGPISVGSSINPGGNDIVLAQLAVSSTPGLLNTSITLPLSGDWTTGDPLAIYWIPSVSTISVPPNVGATVSYGMYTDPSGVGGSDPWITPADGDTHDSIYFSDTGTNFTMNAPAGTGFASLSTVPEPATTALLGAAVALGFAAWRGRKSPLRAFAFAPDRCA